MTRERIDYYLEHFDPLIHEDFSSRLTPEALDEFYELTKLWAHRPMPKWAKRQWYERMNRIARAITERLQA